ncbi:uncharacterized protein OCT59_026136 [Rhizophagus irregularis]|uniref:Uncharacterized protein n=3 Tax=Rhizophagus irregularis TaxID=588596 RepID=A0A2I1GIQ1_9GLOM|nr:hypothetical protein RhiirC2_753252 [Rhizophagus irregularis]GBC17300.1 hypothetical protein RIR_jg33156.t1 [Rhizophagus irregularis DAOM 181602=DAOM 197198]PKY46471.1 hypothetical protein RhiirA4_402530 [Rhizophagus irregularis]UZO05796.1 hypothetical protein OCT59_026136 [Rhizophagus irregularis]CAB4478991.1 unnamed protein product [Rhizophagus irregularis]
MNMYRLNNLSNETIATIGSVISNATEEFEEVLNQIENQGDKQQRTYNLRKYYRTIKQKIKRKGNKPKLLILRQKAKALFKK